MKLPLVIHSSEGTIRKLWEACGQGIFFVEEYGPGGLSGYVIAPDTTGPTRQEQYACFPRWEDAYYCLTEEHWEGAPP